MNRQPGFTALAAGIGRQTWRNLARTRTTQMMTLLTVALSVLVFAFFLLLQLNMLTAGQKLGQDLRLTAYLEQEIDPAERPRLTERLHQSGEIDQISFISRAQARERFARRLGEEMEILAELAPDFLPPAVEVRLRPGPEQFQQLEQLAALLNAMPEVSRVQYGREWLQRFYSFNRLLQVVVLVSGVLLVCNLIFMVSHTIRLTLAARREELEIMRLLGADQALTRGPMLAEGFLQGILGALLGLGALLLLYRWAAGLLGGDGLLGLFTPSFLPPPLLVLIILGSGLLCLVSSLTATK